MALNQWFKFYGGEYLSDTKIASLSAQERSCWITLLSLASMTSEPGKIEFLTTEVLLDRSGIIFDPYNPEEWNACLSVLEKLVRMRMITKSDEGVIEIVNWKKRQETALTNAERQAKYRESNGKITKPVTKVTLDKIREDKNINTSVANAPQEYDEVPEEEKTSKVSLKKYPNAKQVFALWGKYPKNWDLNTTQLRAAENLFEERGVEEVESAIKWYSDLKHLDHCYDVSTPYDLDSKWEKFEKFVEKQS